MAGSSTGEERPFLGQILHAMSVTQLACIFTFSTALFIQCIIGKSCLFSCQLVASSISICNLPFSVVHVVTNVKHYNAVLHKEMPKSVQAVGDAK